MHFHSEVIIRFYIGRFEEVAGELFKVKDRNFHMYVLSPVGVYCFLVLLEKRRIYLLEKLRVYFRHMRRWPVT